MAFLPRNNKNIRIPETQSDDWESFKLTEMSGGLNTSTASAAIGDNQCPVLNNFLLTQNGTLKTRGAYQPYLVHTHDTILTTAPKDFQFVELGGNTHLVAHRTAIGGDEVEHWDGTAWVTILSALLAYNTPVQFAPFATNNYTDLMICNGADVPLRWTGSGSATALGLAAPSNPTGLTKDAETAVINQRGVRYRGDYHYKFTAFYDGGSNTKYGESGPSGSNHITTTLATESEPAQITLTGCPAVPAGATRVFVYRAPAGQSNGPYRQVGYYTSGTTFVDITPDSEEGVEPPLDPGTPPRLKYPVVADGRLVGVGQSSSLTLNHKLVWSEYNQPDVFPAPNFAYLPAEITGIVFFNRDLYIFTTESIYVVPQADFENYDPIKVCQQGCIAPKSIVDVGNGIVFQGHDNIYWVDFNVQAVTGDYPIPIGNPVKDKVQHMPDIAKRRSAATVHKDRYYLSYTVYGAQNTSTLVWDVRLGSSMLRQGSFGGWSTLDWAGNHLQSYRGNLFSAGEDEKYVYEHEMLGKFRDVRNKPDYDGNISYGIHGEIRTKLYHFQDAYRDKTLRGWTIAGYTSGVTFEATVSNAQGNLLSKTIVFDGVDYSSGLAFYGTSRWGTDEYSYVSTDLTTLFKKIPALRSRNFQLNLETANAQNTEIVLLEFLYYKHPMRL